MRGIEPTNAFKRDYKRESRGRRRANLEGDLADVVQTLANDQPLAERFKDHPLTGGWRDHRDCHIRPDLILIYRIPDPNRLQLVRLGWHSELGL